MEEFRTVSLGDLYESPLNNRRHFDEAKLADLTESVRAKGVLVPLLVRENPRKGCTFEILAGARRRRAATAAGLDAVPVRVCEADDQAALEIVLIDNLQREDLQPLEEAEGYALLLKRPAFDVAAIAAKVGKSESYVHQRLKLNELIEPAKKALAEERIHVAHANLIARLQPTDQKEALEHCFEHHYGFGGNTGGKVLVNARSLAGYIESRIMLELGKSAFDARDAALLPAAGACTTCPKRTGFTPALFPELAKRDLCTDRRCYQAKVTAHIRATREAAREAGTPLVEISRDYGGAKGKAVLMGGQYEVLTGQKHCASARKALVVEGHTDLGHTLTICSDNKCKRHRGRFSHHATRSSNTTERANKRIANEKATRLLEAEVRARVFRAVRTAAPQKLGRPELERLASNLLEQGYYEAAEETLVLELLGAVAPKKSARGRVSHSATKHAPLVTGLSDSELAHFLVLMPLLFELGEYNEHDKDSPLFAAAKQYGVDVDAIRAAVKAEAAAKAAAVKPTAKAKAKKQAKRSTRSGSGEKAKNVKRAARAS